MIWTGLAVGLVVIGLQSLDQVFMSGAARASGPTFHPNVLGSAALIATVSLLGGLRTPNNPRLLTTLYLSGIALGLAAIIYSGSRGAYLGLAVSLAVLAAYQLRISRSAGVVVGVVALSIVVALSALLLAPNAISPLLERFTELDDPLDPVGRTTMWVLALELIQNRPFLGYGFGAWSHAATMIEPSFRVDRSPHPHNLYLQLWVDGGALLTVAVMGFAAQIVRTLHRVAISGQFANHSYGPIAVATILGCLANGMTEPLLYHGFLAVLLWLPIAIGVSASPALGDPPSDR